MTKVRVAVGKIESCPVFFQLLWNYESEVRNSDTVMSNSDTQSIAILLWILESSINSGFGWYFRILWI
jgi:hypothetical protein